MARKIRVGINGFGRIGRLFFRAGFKDLEIVGINNLSSVQDGAHLLKYDSTHGRYAPTVTCSKDAFVVDGQVIPFSSEREPKNIPWKAWGADIVLDCTGIFKDKRALQGHVTAGAKRVILSAPGTDIDLMVVYGVNHELYDPQRHHFVSNASCTTNCLAPLVKVLYEAFGIAHGMMTTIHSYTNDQNLLDNSHKDLRRARAATLSMIPTSTGAAQAVGEVFPALKGKIDGLAVRVPTPNVSLVDFVFQAEKALCADKINEALCKAASGALKGVLYCEDLPLVSIDFMGNPHSSLVDLEKTMVIGSHMGKVLAWYDNEMGFSTRMVDLVKYMAGKGL